MDRISQIEIFIRVAETGSFSSAARSLRCDPSSVSRSISALEERLGVKLIARTTRSVSVTEAGRAFLERSKSILFMLDDAEDSARAQHGKLRGQLRIVGMHAISPEVIVPLIKGFMVQHPEISIEVNQVSVLPDLVSNEVDICLRIGSLAAKGLRSIPLVKSSRVICASPAYIDAKGKPQSLSDLVSHNCIGFSLNQQLNIWERDEAEQVKTLRIEGKLLASNAEFIRQAALEGLGVCRLSDFIIAADLQAGRLVPLFPEQMDTTVNHVCAVVPAESQLPARSIAFITYLQATLRQAQGSVCLVGEKLRNKSVIAAH